MVFVNRHGVPRKFCVTGHHKARFPSQLLVQVQGISEVDETSDVRRGAAASPFSRLDSNLLSQEWAELDLLARKRDEVVVVLRNQPESVTGIISVQQLLPGELIAKRIRWLSRRIASLHSTTSSLSLLFRMLSRAIEEHLQLAGHCIRTRDYGLDYLVPDPSKPAGQAPITIVTNVLVLTVPPLNHLRRLRQ